MKKHIFCALLAPLFLLCGCQGPHPRSATYYDLFDTVITFTAYTDDADAFDGWQSTLKNELAAVHQAADPYHTYASTPHNLCEVNALAGNGAVAADEKLLALLHFGQEAYTLTEGKVNVAIGGVTALWKACRDAEVPVLPSEDALSDALSATDFTAVQWDAVTKTISLPSKTALDFGAVAKGWATEQAAKALEKDGCVGIINAGGNVRTIGNKPDGTLWLVRISHPLESETYSLDIRLDGHMAVATSGDYQRYQTVDGVNYAHIIDPETGVPPRHMRAVSVICDDAGMADTLSTALFLMPIDKAIAFTNELDGVEAVFLGNDLQWYYSDGFSAFLT